MHTYTHVCMHAYIHTHIHTHIHTYIHTYMHACMYTHIHTYIHSYVPTYITYIQTHIELTNEDANLLLISLFSSITNWSSFSLIRCALVTKSKFKSTQSRQNILRGTVTRITEISSLILLYSRIFYKRKRKLAGQQSNPGGKKTMNRSHLQLSLSHVSKENVKSEMAKGINVSGRKKTSQGVQTRNVM